MLSSTSLHGIRANRRRTLRALGPQRYWLLSQAVKAYKKLLCMSVQHVVAVDSKDLFTTPSTCRSATDRSIRADVSVIHYAFETHNVNGMLWIPGSVNLADTFTKPDSPLCQPLQLLMQPVKYLSTSQRQRAVLLSSSPDDSNAGMWSCHKPRRLSV